MKNVILSIVSILLIVITGCYNKDKSLTEQYFIGTWSSKNHAKIEFRENGKCELFDFNYRKLNPISKGDSLLNGNCEWKLEKLNGERQVTITYYDGKTVEYLNKKVRSNFKINFNIGGEGLFNQSPPWNLYVFIGDPDDSNKYLFTKDK